MLLGFQGFPPLFYLLLMQVIPIPATSLGGAALLSKPQTMKPFDRFDCQVYPKGPGRYIV